MSTTLNGKPRKQLADQLDRLDTILDGFSDALNESVTDAAREGARIAVKEIVLELLRDPDIQALIRPTLAPVEQSPSAAIPAPPSLWHRIKSNVARFASRVRDTVGGATRRLRDCVELAVRDVRSRVSRTRSRVTQCFVSVKSQLTAIRDTLHLVSTAAQALRTAALVGLVVGVVVAGLSATSHTWAGVIATVSSVGVAVTASVGGLFRGLASRLRIV